MRAYVELGKLEMKYKRLEEAEGVLRTAQVRRGAGCGGRRVLLMPVVKLAGWLGGGRDGGGAHGVALPALPALVLCRPQPLVS